MDIAAYISDLLKEYGELSIPGLGSFARRRINGYYNEAEGVMYPPSFKLSFDEEAGNEDETVAKRIGFSKNISVKSARYFLDKYVTSLKQELTRGQVQFADLGYFYQDERDQIHFVFNNEDLTKDEGFFGYTPIKIVQIRQSVPEVALPEVTAPHVAAELEAPKQPAYTRSLADEVEISISDRIAARLAQKEQERELERQKQQEIEAQAELQAQPEQEQLPEPAPVIEQPAAKEEPVVEPEPEQRREFTWEQPVKPQQPEPEPAGERVPFPVSQVVKEPEPPIQEPVQPAYSDDNNWRRPVDPVILSENITPEVTHVVNVLPDAGDVAAERTEERRAVNVWMILLIIVGAAAIVLFALYQENPTIFSKLAHWQSRKDTLKKAPVAAVKKDSIAPSADTTVKTAAAPDTTGAKPDNTTKPVPPATTPAAEKQTPQAAPAQTPQAAPAQTPQAAPAQTPAVASAGADNGAAGSKDANGNDIIPGVSKRHFEIFGGSFPNMDEALKCVHNYKSLGFPAHTIAHPPSKRVRVSIGAYGTYAEAAAAEAKMVATKKVNTIDLSIESYTYK